MVKEVAVMVASQEVADRLGEKEVNPSIQIVPKEVLELLIS